jgi:fibronectin type 3 domain-containing protein
MGQNFSLYCSNGNIGIGFNTVSQEGGIVVNVGQNDNKFGMNDLVAAFHFSIKVVELITTLVPHSNKALQSDAAEPRH